jgi:hypothetical protein
MSSTRRAAAGSPVAFNKYMSSPEYVEHRGIDGIAATAKGSMLTDAKERNLLFFLQALSLRPGGIANVADELVLMFPDRVHHGTKQDAAERISDVLIEFCINPSKRLKDLYALWFQDIGPALLEYQTRFGQAAKADLAETEIALHVTKCLDRAIRHRKMVVLEGEPGIGKTKASKTWCEMNLGRARFVTLSGCVNKTSIFRTIGRALGIASGYMRGATEMQARVEDALQRSGLMLVIDEAHFLFGQSERIYSRPEMIDWINTALCNQGVPVALVATPQLTARLHQAEKQTLWQSSQFRRRIKDFARLPKAVGEADIESVARKTFPDISGAAIKLIVGQALLSQWPLTWIGNLAEDVQEVMTGRDRKTAFEDIEKAIKQFRTPSDLAQVQAYQPQRRRKAEPISQAEEIPARQVRPAATPLITV